MTEHFGLAGVLVGRRFAEIEGPYAPFLELLALGVVLTGIDKDGTADLQIPPATRG